MSGRAADAAVAALSQVEGLVEVLGAGTLAQAVIAQLGARHARGGGRPAAAIDTTGEMHVIEDAMKRVADLGTVVLAGPPPVGPVELDLYADLHVRGLTIVTIARAPANPARRP